MSEIKNGGLDQYGAGPFEQQQFGTAGVEGVKWLVSQHEMAVVMVIIMWIVTVKTNLQRVVK